MFFVILYAPFPYFRIFRDLEDINNMWFSFGVARFVGSLALAFYVFCFLGI